ncbi:MULTISPECIES: SMC-Scp complex subunit ScpB [Pseudonocardia]|uniref:SMC-Scp complex subunit ScpB n=1 Tax=Pseudonocardia TaxID=1847 RepID=UPI0018D5849A
MPEPAQPDVPAAAAPPAVPAPDASDSPAPGDLEAPAAPAPHTPAPHTPAPHTPAPHTPPPDDRSGAPAPPEAPEPPSGAAEPEEDPDEVHPGADEPSFAELADDTELEKTLEALLLVVDTPVDEESLATTLDQTPSRIRQTLNRMSLAYTADDRGIDLRRVGGGWRFYTRDRYAPYVEKLLLDGQRARLTRAALETLAVVAYRQPVTRARVAAVRGVNCDGVLRTLLTRGLVEEAGTEEHTGGTLFRTTELFLERLGLSSVQELPPLAPLLPDIDAIDDLES